MQSKFNDSNQHMQNEAKLHYCPKCNENYEINCKLFMFNNKRQYYNVYYFVTVRNNILFGRVPLILKCNHTMCEVCIRLLAVKREIMCAECNEISVAEANETKKLQEIFPINFYLVGLIYYSNPKLNETSKINLKPTGARYKNRLPISNSLLNTNNKDNIISSLSKYNISEGKHVKECYYYIFLIYYQFY